MRRNGTSVTCPICNSLFWVSVSRAAEGKGKYCSKACYTRASGGAVALICAVCAQPFNIPPWRQRRGDAKYCSKTCANTGQSIPVERTCEHCQAAFTVRPSETAYKKGKYCSLQCRRASGNYNPPIQHTCKNCGKAFKVFVSTAAQYPAMECSTCWRSRFRTTTDRNGWEYRRWRTAVYQRDAFTCQRCNIQGGRLHAHHIKAWAQYPALRFDVSNGMTLHEECHRALHIEMRSWYFA